MRNALPSNGARRAPKPLTWSVGVLLVLLAFALRVYRLGQPALRGDEAFSIVFARNPMGDMLRQFTAATEPHPPLSFLVLHVWARLAGESEFALRLTSVWAGILVVPLLYALGRTLWGHPTGLVAAAAAAWNPFYIWHAQEARMYAMLVAFTLASVLAFWTLLHRRGWGWPIAYGLVTALAIYTHYYAFLVVAVQGLYALLDWVLAPGLSADQSVERRERLCALIRFVAGLALAGLLYLPWILSSWEVLNAYHGRARSGIPWYEPFYRCLLVFGQGQTLPKRTALWWLPLWGGLFIMGCVVAWQRDRRRALFTLLYLLVPWAIVYVDSLQRPAFDERYFMVGTPPFHLLVALAWGALLRKRRVGRGLAGAAAVLALVACGLSLHNYYHDPAYARAPDWRAARDFFLRHVREGETVIVNLPDPAVRYYFAGVPWSVLPESYPVDRAATFARLDRLAQAHARIWLMPQRWPTWDAEGLVEGWLDAHTERVAEFEVDRFKIHLYHPPHRLQEEMRPLDVQFEGGIRLLGYVLRDVEGQTVERFDVRPGETVWLTLYWQAEAQIERDYTVFAHILDPTGWLRGQQDNPPRQGTWPTSVWVPGDLVVDRYSLPVAADAPPGLYSIEVGLYRPEDGTRLPIRGEHADPAQARCLLRDVVRVP